MGEVIQWHCPQFGIVKAVKGCDSGSSFICQNPEVRSKVVKMDELARPIPDAFANLFHGVLVDVGVLIEQREVLHDPESLALLLRHTKYG
jgi:hypothetical protein